MNNIRRLFYSTISLIALLFALPTLGSHSALAQAPFPPTLQIIDVDTTHFPALAIAIGGTNWPVPLDTLPATVTLDGRELPINADQTGQRGIQLALAIDVNGISARNDAGQSGYVEMTGTLLDLVEADAFRRDEDWLAAYQLQGENEPLAVQEWTQEPNLLFNSVVGKRPPEVNDAPLTAQSLIKLLTLMANGPESATRPRVLLLFSTGATIDDLTPVLTVAQTARVAIHVVELLGNAGTPQSTTLQQLATQSGGHYTALTNPDRSTTVSEALATAHTVRLLQSRADSATLQTLTVAVTLPDNSTVDATIEPAAFADLTVEPVQIAIVAPAAAVNWNDLAGDPATGAQLLPVQAQFAWPDGYPRAFMQVSYTLRGPGGFAQQAIRTAAPFDQATLPLADLADGAYTLEIRAIDELAVEAAVATAQIQFSDLPSVLSSQPALVAADTPVANVVAEPPAPQAQTAATLAEASAITQPSRTAAEATDAVIIPGLGVAVPRALLVGTLPLLLLLIGYLIYSERRDRRRQNDAQPALTKPPLPTATVSDPLFALRDESQPLAGKRYQLNTAEQNHTQRYTIADDNGAVGVPAVVSKISRPVRTAAPAPAPDHGKEPLIHQEAVPAWLGDDRLVWDDEAENEDEITIAPVRMQDEEATYRTEEVARPLLGYLMRTTSDPNLPKELPIYSLSPAPGELRQIHIGRHSKHNTVVINDKRVSREHAVIVQRDGRLYLRDNASTAGTFLNWKRLNPGEELLLRHNDLISFGEIAYEFRLHGEDEATITNG